jgi:hypothetical protein
MSGSCWFQNTEKRILAALFCLCGALLFSTFSSQIYGLYFVNGAAIQLVPSSFRNPVFPSTQQHKNKLGSFSLKLLCANGSDHLSDEQRSVWHAGNTTRHTHTYIYIHIQYVCMYIYIYSLGLGFLRPSALRTLGVLGCDAVLYDKELRMNLLLPCWGWKSCLYKHVSG